MCSSPSRGGMYTGSTLKGDLASFPCDCLLRQQLERGCSWLAAAAAPACYRGALPACMRRSAGGGYGKLKPHRFRGQHPNQSLLGSYLHSCPWNGDFHKHPTGKSPMEVFQGSGVAWHL